jgi:hypothetical protein
MPPDQTTQPGLTARYPRTVGVLILLALHVAFIVAPAMAASSSFRLPGGEAAHWLAIGEWTGLERGAAPLLIGLVQLLYVIPAVLLALKLHRPKVAKGILIGAVGTFVVNLAGCGVFLYQLSRIEG